MITASNERPFLLRRNDYERTARSHRWVESLRCSDVDRLWTELHRLVCRHPLVRTSKRTGWLIEAGSNRAYKDLTQELFLQLLNKRRFQHYLDAEMTDYEIEREIGQIELTNLLTGELRRQCPESYRLARRISTLIQSSPSFRRFHTMSMNNEVCPRLTARIYGLCEWEDDKARRELLELERRVQMIPVRQRNRRLVGCTGDSQIVISNADLDDLIVSVLKAADAPVDLRTLRSLVMSRLPIMDMQFVSLGGSDENDRRGQVFEPIDERETPEREFLRRESEQEATKYVDKFLGRLRMAVRGKAKQYNRLLSVLWYCYLSQEHWTQLKIATALGVSDSLVSDYRNRIEKELRALAFSEIEEGRRFEMALRECVQRARKQDSEHRMVLRSPRKLEQPE